MNLVILVNTTVYQTPQYFRWAVNTKTFLNIISIMTNYFNTKLFLYAMLFYQFKLF